MRGSSDGQLPGLRIDARTYQPWWLGQRALRHAVEGAAHELDPDRQCGTATGLAVAERREVVEADPCRGGQRRVETVEPGVALIVGGAGLASEVAAAELQCAATGAVAHDVAEQRVHQVGIAWFEYARRRLGDGL